MVMVARRAEIEEGFGFIVCASEGCNKGSNPFTFSGIFYLKTKQNIFCTRKMSVFFLMKINICKILTFLLVIVCNSNNVLCFSGIS